MGLIMTIKDWLTGGVKTSTIINGDNIHDLVGETQIRELALWSCVNMIGNSISKCEFKTFQKHKEVKEGEYYLWNIEPNKNQGSSVFMHKLISKLLLENECLVISEGDQLLIADSFSMKEYALFDNTFSDVQVGDFAFNKTYKMSDVLYFKWSEKNMAEVVKRIFDSYGKMVSYTMDKYKKSKGIRGILNMKNITPGNLEEKEKLDKLMNESFAKGLFKNENSVLPLTEGYDFQPLNVDSKGLENTRDIRAMIDDISDFTAKAFGIPPALVRGDIAGIKDAMDSYLTFCIDPLVDMIEEEINRKRNGYAGYSKGQYLKIDTKTIMHVDILTVSTNIDKLISSGAFTINDIRDLVGESIINEDFANKHFITKNYSTVENTLAPLEIEDGERRDE